MVLPVKTVVLSLMAVLSLMISFLAAVAQTGIPSHTTTKLKKKNRDYEAQRSSHESNLFIIACPIFQKCKGKVTQTQGQLVVPIIERVELTQTNILLVLTLTRS